MKFSQQPNCFHRAARRRIYTIETEVLTVLRIYTSAACVHEIKSNEIFMLDKFSEQYKIFILCHSLLYTCVLHVHQQRQNHPAGHF